MQEGGKTRTRIVGLGKPTAQNGARQGILGDDQPGLPYELCVPIALSRRGKKAYVTRKYHGNSCVSTSIKASDLPEILLENRMPTERLSYLKFMHNIVDICLECFL